MKPNIILNLYPMTKLYFTLFISVAILIVPNYYFIISLFSSLLIVSLFAGLRVFKEFIRIILKALLFLIIIVFLMQLFFYPGETVLGEWGIFQWTSEGLQYGLSLSSKILVIGSAFILFFRITEVKDFVKALEDKGLPPSGAYVAMSTLQIIPEMKRQAITIMDAQKTRGVETEGSLLVRAKAFIPTLTPLILSSIASTEERAITLESRAFSAPVKKTHLYKLSKNNWDRVLPFAFLLVLIALVVWRFLS